MTCQRHTSKPVVEPRIKGPDSIGSALLTLQLAQSDIFVQLYSSNPLATAEKR